MEEDKNKDDSNEPRVQPLEDVNQPEEMDKEDEIRREELMSSAIADNPRGKQADESLQMFDDYIKRDDPMESDNAFNKQQTNEDGESHGAVIVSHANGGSTDQAESTESYEFANGSDETSSWESFSGKF